MQGFISRIRNGIVIFLLLALCELVFADMSANCIIVFGFFGCSPFMLGSAAVLLLAFVDLVWCALRAEYRSGAGMADFARMGAFSGLLCSVLACALMLACAAFGSGIALLLAGSEVAAMLSLAAFCTLLGAVAGVAASKALPLMVKRAKAKAKAHATGKKKEPK